MCQRHVACFIFEGAASNAGSANPAECSKAHLGLRSCNTTGMTTQAWLLSNTYALLYLVGCWLKELVEVLAHAKLLKPREARSNTKGEQGWPVSPWTGWMCSKPELALSSGCADETMHLSNTAIGGSAAATTHPCLLVRPLPCKVAHSKVYRSSAH